MSEFTKLSEAERNLQQEERPPLYRFVFTGGPCGGKTTALARVFSFLRERGFEVITCPEAFTILNSNGMSVDFFSTGGMARIIQGTVMDVQMSIEEGVDRVLRARGKPAVILCDRGMMDGSVYVSYEEFQKVVEERNTDVVQLRDNRYDGKLALAFSTIVVGLHRRISTHYLAPKPTNRGSLHSLSTGIFHLVTAADGAEQYYTLENNKVRSESPEQAREVDKRTQKAWVGHPHLYVIDNSTDFEGKMSRLVDVISKIVGLPSNLKRRSAKFLLHSPPGLSSFPAEVDYQVFEVEKAYLQQSEEENKENYSFIRRRTNVDANGKLLGSVFQLTTVKWAGEEMIEQKRIISKREYSMAYQTRDRHRHVVKQRRISFLYAKQSFTVHIYKEPVSDLCILHAQVEASSDGEPEVLLPPFLDVDRRIYNTKEDEKKYGAYSLSIME